MINIIDFLVVNLNVKKDEIAKLEKFESGFLNYNYLVTMNDERKYVVRITKYNPLVNHAFEYLMMAYLNQTSDFIFYDLKTGNYIRSYYLDEIDGDWRKCYKYLNYVIKAIKQNHHVKVDKSYPKYNYEMYVDLDGNGDKYFDLYKSLIKKIKETNMPLVISHNDINPTNVLGFEHEVHLIDYEFSCLNYDYFDYGYFLKEMFIKQGDLINLSIKQNWNYELMLDFIYIATYISYSWSLTMERSEAINEYHDKMKKRIDYYFDLIKN